MRLSELLEELRQVKVGVVGRWELHGKRGLMLGDPEKYFPYPTGPQYPVDCTRDQNPELSSAEVAAIRRRFGIGET